MSDIAAPAPTRHRCSPSPGSPAPPRPRQWHLPGLTSFLPLSLPPSHPLACACGAAPARLLPAWVQTCGSLRCLPAYLRALRLSLLQAKGREGVSSVIRSCDVRKGECLRTRQEAFTVASRGPGRPPSPNTHPVRHFTLHPPHPAPRGSTRLTRSLGPSPSPGHPGHLPAPPPVRTVSCPSFAWARAPRSHLRLLLPAPSVGIAPACFQLAVPQAAFRGRLEARATPSRSS